MEFKDFWKSKTIWWNALTVITVVVAFFGYEPNQQLAEQIAALLTALSPLVNIFLRTVTNKAIR